MNSDQPEAHATASFQSTAEMWDLRYSETAWSLDPDPSLVELVSGLKPGKAIDFGCGTGRNTIWLARNGWQVTGVDISKVGLSQARERAEAEGLDVNLVQTNILDYKPLPEFDLAALFNIHLDPNDFKHLVNLAVEALVPTGHLLIVGHHLDNLGHHGPPDPARLYTEASIRSALPAKMKLDQVERIERETGNDENGASDIVLVAWASIDKA